MAGPAAGGALHEQLERWTAEGLIDADQAHRIEAAEHGRTAAAPRRRLPLVAEVLGYTGAVIALTAAAITLGQFWKHIPPAAELAFAAVAAIGLLVAGAAVRTGADPAFARLRSALWLLATASVAGFAAILGDKYLHVSGTSVAVLSSAAWLAAAVPLWWRTKAVVQHVAAFGGAVAFTEAGLASLDPGVGAFGGGLALWTLAGLWGIAAWRGYLPPRAVGLLLSGAGLLLGSIISMDAAAGQALAAATVAGLLAAGIITRKVLVIVMGAIGVVYVVPATATRYLPGSVAAPLAVAVVGLALLGIALRLARTRHRA